jgi:hypothetical protein
MNRVKKKFPFLMLFILPYGLYAWGDADKLNGGGCQYDKETGYSGSSLYTKGNDAYIIVDVTDTRYGTTSTVYNAITCEKVTSGNKSKSNFSGFMEEKGFSLLSMSSRRKTVDKSFSNEVGFSEDSDALKVETSSIDSSVSVELQAILSSLSDKSANPNITISETSRKFFNNKEFYELFLAKIQRLSNQNINYAYAFSLNKMLKNDESINSRLITNYFNLHVKKLNDVEPFVNAMEQFGQKYYMSGVRTKVANLPDFAKNLTLDNFLTSKEYAYVFKYMKPKVYKKEDGSTYGLTLDYGDKSIKLTQTGSCEQGSNSTSEFSCGFMWVNTCVGTYENYSCKGDTSKIAQIEREVLGTTKVASSLNKGWGYSRMISRYTKASSGSSSSGERDMQNSCLAQVKHDNTFCYSINNKDMQKSCLAQVKHDNTFCYSINNKDMQKSCLAQVTHDDTFCYRINNKNMQKSCLAQVTHDDTFCYRINNKNMQNSCLAQVKHDDTFCYSIQ